MFRVLSAQKKVTEVTFLISRLDIEHTSENIKDRIIEVLQEYGAEEKVVCSTTDNASNETGAMSLAGIPNFGGFAHTLNLTVKKALAISIGGEMEEIVDPYGDEEPAATTGDFEKLHSKISKLVTRTRKSSNAKREFRQCQQLVNRKPRKLKQFCKTRWNRDEHKNFS